MIRGPQLFVVALAGCAFEASPPSAERVPVRWQLVEHSYRHVPDRGAAGDGRVDPEATVLAFEPLYPEDLGEPSRPGPARLSVEIVELLPDGEVGPGQPISAAVRVANAAPQGRYRLRIEALDPRVRVLGEPERTVKGSESATFRFTSAAPGKRGITIEVEEMD